MKKWIKNHYNWIRDHYDQLSNIASAILSVFLSLVASYVYDILKGEESVPSNCYIIGTLIIFVLAAIVGISFLSKRIKKDLFKADLLNNNIQKAYLAIQDLSLESQSYLQQHNNDDDLIDWVFQNIQLAVDKCYDFFSSSFGSGKILIAETKFEVTYMTLSYKDSKITIPCSCNREKRTPMSMLMREEDPDIYKKTVTAIIYAEYNLHRKPTLRIVENTEKNTGDADEYHFVYANQKDRIKSSVVLPVLSHKNELLGTLVVHCNTPGFFKKEQSAFWYEILQLFASEIGKNKLLLDKMVTEGRCPF